MHSWKVPSVMPASNASIDPFDSVAPGPTIRVFVTGARGLLGSALVPYLESRAYQVIAARSRADAAAPADLTRMANVDRALDAVRPDVVINLAALTDVDYCEAHPDEAYRVNAGLVGNLVRWIEANGSSTRLIQISTDQVYDGEGPHEETGVCPGNFYSYSKCLAEEYVRQVAGTSLRTNFFGKSTRPGRVSFSDWIVGSMRASKHITVFRDVLFSPLSLGALVRSIELVIARPATGTFNLGSRGGMSKADFAFKLADAAGLPTVCLTRGSVSTAARAARRPCDMRMDSRKFEAAFGGPGLELADEIQVVGRGYRDEGI
jgi:dTDP-4-dehydrorhamnose reductase